MTGRIMVFTLSWAGSPDPAWRPGLEILGDREFPQKEKGLGKAQAFLRVIKFSAVGAFYC